MMKLCSYIRFNRSDLDEHDMILLGEVQTVQEKILVQFEKPLGAPLGQVACPHAGCQIGFNLFQVVGSILGDNHSV